MNKVKICICDSLFSPKYLINNNIYYDSLSLNNNSYTLIVSFDDYKKISRRYKTYIVNYYGKERIKIFLYVNRYFVISVLIGLILLFNLSATIFSIRINVDNHEVRDRIINSLNNYGISVKKKKKSFDEISIIKDKILKENEDIIEWIEIEEHGCNYIVNLTERVIKENNVDNEPSSIVASKDGVIKHIVIYSGTQIKEINDYVKKGDLLISGNIIKDEEVVDKVKSIGEVYAEVWYIVKVEVPFEYNKNIDTGKVINRYYIDINNNEFTIIGKYNGNNVKKSKSVFLDKYYLPFKIYKERINIFKNVTYKLDYDSALKEGIKKCESNINKRLGKGEYVISKNVLKKEVNSSKIIIEVFFKVFENIGVTSNIELIGEKQ